MSAALLEAVRQRLAESGAEPTPAGVAAALRAQGRLLGDAEVLGVTAQLRGELVGTGPLEPLLADAEVTDVLVSAPDRVWVDRGGGLELTGVTFADAASVRRLAQRLAAVAERRLDDAHPWVDARLPDGTRIHAVIPPVAVGSTCLSLRVARHRAFSLRELVEAGTLPPGGDRVLRALMAARLSFLISGGTGSGKTTHALRHLYLSGRGDAAGRLGGSRPKMALTCPLHAPPTDRRRAPGEGTPGAQRLARFAWGWLCRASQSMESAAPVVREPLSRSQILGSTLIIFDHVVGSVDTCRAPPFRRPTSWRVGVPLATASATSGSTAT